jgi:nucleoid DNA-binding protein
MPTKPTTPKSPAKSAGAESTSSKVGKPMLVHSDGMPVADDAAEDVAADAVKNGMRLKALVDHVVEATGAKRKDVKLIVEATLAKIGETLKSGENLNLPGLGKLRVARQAAEGGGAMTLKLRHHSNSESRAELDDGPLADDADQD